MASQSEQLSHNAVGDEHLVLAFQAGLPDAYDEIFRRYHARVSHVCTRMLGNRADAEEAAQETFLKAYQALGRFNGSYQLGAWLSRIATNVCLDRLRVRSRSATTLALQGTEEMTEAELGPEELIIGGDRRVETAMSAIYPLHARALRLRAEGFSHEEIGKRLAMTPAQVKALLHRARLSFRRIWQKAEGWALAPLIAFRSVLHKHRGASEAGSNVAASTAYATPFIAERTVVAAAMVAAAISGLPTGPSRSTEQAAPRVADVGRKAPARTATQRVAAAGNPSRSQHRSQPTSIGPAAPEPKAAKSALDDVQREIQQRKKELEKKKGEMPGGPNETKDGDDGPPVAKPNAKPVEKEVKRLQQELVPPAT